MTRFFRSLRTSTLAGVVLASMAFAAADRAGAITLPFDFAGTPKTFVIDGTSGTLSFSLDMGDPSLNDVFGSFAMDVVRQSDNAVLGSISLDSILFGASNDFGDIAGTAVIDSPFNLNTWIMSVVSGDPPLSLMVTSVLSTLGTAPLAPILTLDITGDLRIVDDVSAVPLPAALPLFAGGLGLLGLLGLRRRRAQTAV